MGQGATRQRTRLDAPGGGQLAAHALQRDGQHAAVRVCRLQLRLRELAVRQHDLRGRAGAGADRGTEGRGGGQGGRGVWGEGHKGGGQAAHGGGRAIK